MSPRQMIKRAVEHHQSGQLDEAERLYRAALDESPNDADAWHLLGVLTGQRGNKEGARQLVARAIEIDPSADLYHVNLGTLNGACGHSELAVANFRRAIELNPNVPAVVHAELAQALSALSKIEEAIHALQWAVRREPRAEWLVALAELLQRAGRQQEALDRLKQAIQARPDLAEAHGALGLAMEREGRLAEAEACYHKALELNPDLVQALNNLGHVLNGQRRWDEAIKVLERAVELHPNLAQAYNNLGDAFRGQNRSDAAIACYRQALQLNPNLQGAWDSLGSILLSRRELPAAADAFRKSTALRPTSASLVDLARAAAGVDQYDEAIDALNKAAELSPSASDPHRVLGVALRWCGRLDEAIDEFKRAMYLDPRDHAAHSGLLYAMLFHDRAYTPEQIFQEHVEWGRRHASLTPSPAAPGEGGGEGDLERRAPLEKQNHPNPLPAYPAGPEQAPPDKHHSPDRRLRIGYISPNFRNTAVLMFVLPILRNHDAWEVEVFCYSDAHAPDEWTAQVRERADEWRDTSKMTDEQLARQIREDRIDIAVELSGHIGDGRLLALACKPAPIQISYIGYQATTGVSAIDYFLTDGWADPPGQTERFFVERLIRLPESFFCYAPPPEAPAVGPLPAAAAGFVTLGCQNNLAKVTPRTIELWSTILHAVPDARFMLLTPGSREVDERVLNAFESHGIVRERIELVRRATPVEYLARYNRIDIALDPVPFNGHTTTCDAAWMGCPTVTLSGQIYAHRYGGSVLRNVGLSELVATSDEQYIAIATTLAGDLHRLEQIRSNLRVTMSQSIITDGARFTRNLERAYRQMWCEWCAS